MIRSLLELSGGITGKVTALLARAAEAAIHRRDEKVMISGALTLLTNAVIAYNTWKLHQVLERSREAGRPVPSDEILAHIAKHQPSPEDSHFFNASDRHAVPSAACAVAK